MRGNARLPKEYLLCANTHMVASSQRSALLQPESKPEGVVQFVSRHWHRVHIVSIMCNVDVHPRSHPETRDQSRQSPQEEPFPCTVDLRPKHWGAVASLESALPARGESKGSGCTFFPTGIAEGATGREQSRKRCRLEEELLEGQR